MIVRSAITCLLIIATVFAKAQPRPVVIDYINTYKALAIAEMQRTGIPAAIKLAQGIHETEAGSSDLVRKSNNHFGIKCKNTWTGDKVYHDDDARGECFRSYASAEDSYRDHSNFLKGSPRYAFLFELDPTDFEGWAYGLKKAGYATNIKYSQILIRIINDYHLQDYTLIAMGKMKPEDEWLAKETSSSPVILPEQVKIETTTEEGEKAIVIDQTPNFPEGEFKINDTRVVYAKPGSSLLAIAQQYDVSLKRLMDFNEMREENILPKGQLVFLQRKRKHGSQPYHTVQAGETTYDVAQAEGIRLDNLLDLNHLNNGMQPAIGEKLYLKEDAPTRPLLAEAKSPEAEQPIIKTVPQEAAYTTHIVQTKETLYAISKKYGVPIEKLRQWNNLVSYDLKTGQELIIYKN